MTNDGSPQWPQPEAPGWVVVHVKGSVVTAGPPKIYVDGQVRGASFGPNSVQVAPGRHTIGVASQWMRTYGKASMEVEVPPGQIVNVYYAGPHNQWVNKGNMGVTPQKRPDTLSFLAIIAAVLVAVAVVGFIVTG